MSLRLTLATAARVLRQLRSDRRTIALLIVVPCVLLGLIAWIYDGTPVFDSIGPALLGIFPMTVMFIVTSIATLRERTSGTLERLLASPLHKADLMFGYAAAFALVALVQALIVVAFAVWVCGLDVRGEVWLLGLVGVFDAVLGTALGLLASGFARTEFQAVQFMPAFIFPQMILCGLFMERSKLPTGLRQLSNVLPLSYAVDAMQAVQTQVAAGGEVAKNLAIIAGFALLSLALGSLTLRRRTA